MDRSLTPVRPRVLKRWRPLFALALLSLAGPPGLTVQAQGVADTTRGVEPAPGDGVVTGRVSRAGTDEPLPGLAVRFVGEGGDSDTFDVRSAEGGLYRLALPAGRYSFQSPSGPLTGRVDSVAVDTVEVEPGATVALDLALIRPKSDGLTVSRTASVRSSLPDHVAPESEFFRLAGINYFSTGTDWSGESRGPFQNRNQIKFRVSVRYQFFNVYDAFFSSKDGGQTGLYLSYIQNSFWHFFDPSGPFFDNNYGPGLFAHADTGELGLSPSWVPSSYEPALSLGVFHESNGRDGLASRSWNRAVVGVGVGSLNRTVLSGGLSLWYPMPGDENPDLADYTGRGELTVGFQPRVDGFEPSDSPITIQARSRVWGRRPAMNLEVNALFDVPLLTSLFRGDVRPRAFKPHLMAQFFTGYAENLLTYTERRTVVRFGFAFLR
ncbi:MAG TPA: phospholipase A [Rubricoccaceae bacterium]|jgi:phospholipase A1